MRRLFVPAERLAAGRLPLHADDGRYLVRVLRLRAGARLVVFDGAGHEADAVLTEEGETAGPVVLDVGALRDAAGAPAAPITLVVALLKGEKMDLVVQKTTELGVARVVPAATERAVVRLAEARTANRLQRWARIAREAARQCGRADVPEIAPPAPWVDALGHAGDADLRLVCHEQATRPLVPIALEAPPGSTAVAVGPEGGLTDDEVEQAARAGFEPCRLGPRVLRAETCAIAAVAVLGGTRGDLGTLR